MKCLSKSHPLTFLVKKILQPLPLRTDILLWANGNEFINQCLQEEDNIVLENKQVVLR